MVKMKKIIKKFSKKNIKWVKDGKGKMMGVGKVKDIFPKGKGERRQTNVDEPNAGDCKDDRIMPDALSTSGKCSNCGHDIWIAGKQVGHKGNSTGDLCFEDGCTCDNPRALIKSQFQKTRDEGIGIVKNIRKTMLPDYDLHDALWVHWHDHFQKKITDEENKIKDLIKVLEKTTSRDGEKVIIDLSHLREYIRKQFPELSKKQEAKE